MMKANLRLLIPVLALLAGLRICAQPSIGISPAGDQSILYWATTPTNYFLQSATNLASPNWVAANDTVSVTAATISNTSPARFFRLVYTNPPAGMALIPAGWFTMGDTLDGQSDAIPTNIYVSAFYMDTNLVSYGLWQTVYNAATLFNGYSFVNAGIGKATNQPVQEVDWYDCLKWCNARSQLAGLTPVYYTDVGFSQVCKTGEPDAIFVNWAANGFRLPTEAEWEKAARGGLSGRRFPWGNRIDENQANYLGSTSSYAYDFGPNGYNSIGSVGGTSPATSPVGSFEVNGYGLYDMAGNVFEFCWDWYGTPYGIPTQINPTGPATGTARVTRGGDWSHDARAARCAFRGNRGPYDTTDFIGFRCVKGL